MTGSDGGDLGKETTKVLTHKKKKQKSNRRSLGISVPQPAGMKRNALGNTEVWRQKVKGECCRRKIMQ